MLEYIAPVAASLTWSLNPAIISKYRRHIKPILFTGFRALAAIIFLFPIAVFTGLTIPDAAGLSLLIIMTSAVLGPGVGDASYTKAIQVIGGSLAVVLSYTYIFVSQFIAAALLHEPLKPSVLIGSLLAFAGIIVASVNGGGVRVSAKGIGYALLASLSWGVATVMIKVALFYADVFTLTVMRLGFTAVFFIPAGLIVEGGPSMTDSKPMAKAALITGVLGWSIGMLLFIYSIGMIGVSATAVATALTPVLSQLTVKALSREKPALKTIIGALLISTGIASSLLLN